MSAFRRPHDRHAARAHEHRVLRAIGLVLSAIAGFGLVFVYSFGNTALAAAETVDISSLLAGENRPEPPAPPVDGTKGVPLNILLMGSDSRAGENGSIGGRVAGGMRNDTTIIMHISAARDHVELISIPRDSRVAVPDCTLFNGDTVRGWTGKFNIAFANGGRNGNPAEAAACTITAVEQLTGIYINYYMVIDFAGFRDMINALGGVPMCIPERLYSSHAKLNLKAGPQILNGSQALAYARMRKAEIGHVDGTDPQRIGRQQELLANVANTVKAKNLLFDLPSLTAFIKAGAKSMTMSPELGDFNYLLGLAFSLRHITSDNIVFATVPWKFAGQGDVEWTPAAYTMFKRVIDDKNIRGDKASTIGDAGFQTPEADPSATPDPTASPTETTPPKAVCTNK